jgi:catechol 2,3-dioxygenase-like lactoylglutathione lyase family enzyme
MITRASTASINVSDQDEALEFYTGKLGFRKVKDEPMSADSRWIEVAPPGAETRIVLFKPDDENDIGGFSNIVFECDGMQATYEELRSKGVEFTAEPTDATSWGPNAPRMWAQFKDPDGNEFGLAQF